MAEIRFQLLKQADGKAALPTLSGSGLAFYGATAGSSVQIGAYQGVTRVANADGSVYQDETNNIKYVADTFPSGRSNIAGSFGTPVDVGLSGIKSMQGTLGIEFGHTVPVTVQNAQVRIYDRASVNRPASGVNTKMAEIINFNGSTSSNQGALGDTSDAVGSGDAFWWGEPWPSALVTQNYFVNSTAITFYNGKDTDAVVNGDSRLATAGVAGSYDTVGGTGIVVPLMDSPGSGGKQLQVSETISGTGMAWPKWTQYITTTSNQAAFFGNTAQNFGDGSANKILNYGGTGVDTHHTWSLAISASPLSTGSKEEYGLYMSLEYL